MPDTKTIRITCRAAALLPLEAIERFQGNLKARTQWDIDKIIKSIEEYGFSFPFFIWVHEGHNYCLDGHGRIAALTAMQQRGYVLPEFPIAYIEAADEAEAKQKLLRENSRYGQLSYDSVMEFAGDMTVDFGALAIPEGKLMFDAPHRCTEKQSEQPSGLCTLSFLNYHIPATDDESALLRRRIDRYIDENGAAFGFITELLEEAG